MERDKTLIERCIEFDFSFKIHEIEYCRLAMGTKRVECDYLAQIKDHNGLYPCMLTGYFNTETKPRGDLYMPGKKKKC